MKISEFHYISTLLYPPLRSLNNWLTTNEKNSIHSKITQLMNELKATEVLQTEIIECQQPVDLCFQDFIDLPQTPDICESELDVYINSPPNYSINSSILLFWENNKSKYPRLYSIARRLLSIPATNLSSERNFSAAGFTLNDRRSNLSPENVNYLLFIRSNFDLI
jgi:hypothetical protein